MSLELGDRREALILVPQKRSWSDKLGGWLEIFLLFLVIYVVTFVLLVLLKPEWVLKPPASILTTETTATTTTTNTNANAQKQKHNARSTHKEEASGATTRDASFGIGIDASVSPFEKEKEKKSSDSFSDTQTIFEPHLFAEELLKSLVPPKLREAAQTVGTILKKSSVLLGSGNENNFYDFWANRILKTQYTPFWEEQEIDLLKISYYSTIPPVMFLLAIASLI